MAKVRHTGPRLRQRTAYRVVALVGLRDSEPWLSDLLRGGPYPVAGDVFDDLDLLVVRDLKMRAGRRTLPDVHVVRQGWPSPGFRFRGPSIIVEVGV